MESTSKKFIIVRDKAGAAVLTSPAIYNTIEDARDALKSIAEEQFGPENWVATWCSEDKVEFYTDGLTEKLVYVIQEMDLKDVYSVVVSIPVRMQVKASSWEDAKKKAIEKANDIVSSKKMKDALTAAGFYRMVGLRNFLPITVVCENGEGRQ